MVSATAVVIGVLLAVASGMEKRGGDKMAQFPDGLGAMSRVEGAVCCFLLVLLAVLEHWAAVLCDELMMVHLLHFLCCGGVG